MAKNYGNLKLTILGGVVLAVLIGAGQVLSQTPTPEEKLEEKIKLYNEISRTPTMDPTAIAAKDEQLQKQMAADQQDYAEWLEDFKASGIDLRSLPLVELEAYYRSGPSTVDESVRDADVIVIGTVTTVEFRATQFSFPDAVVEFRVEEALAGTTSETLEIVFNGGPVRTPQGAALGYRPLTPLLLPGDEAILLLKAHPQDPDVLIPQAYTGVNKIQDGVVQASKRPDEVLDSSVSGRARSELDGRRAEEVLALLKTAIARR